MHMYVRRTYEQRGVWSNVTIARCPFSLSLSNRMLHVRRPECVCVCVCAKCESKTHGGPREERTRFTRRCYYIPGVCEGPNIPNISMLASMLTATTFTIFSIHPSIQPSIHLSTGNATATATLHITYEYEYDTRRTSRYVFLLFSVGRTYLCAYSRHSSHKYMRIENRRISSSSLPASQPASEPVSEPTYSQCRAKNTHIPS